MELKESIDSHFEKFNDRLSVVENNVRLIQDEWSEFKNSKSTCDAKYDMNDIVAEIEERKLRSSNVMLFNICESTASELATKIQTDLDQVTSILGTFPPPKKVVRIGTPKPNITRPLKIRFDNKVIVKEVLRTNRNNDNRQFHFHPDLTNMQREINNTVRKEYKDRLARGESDITFKYKNNQPYITKKIDPPVYERSKK
ncbi:hypothetical protein Zmor_001608 [Zophobas morio]|uniref:Uncharacterized protein n=1 Tax=Zophobas morio TaxID=2755281 RepID=A0AA38J480_9CUCU|nr:hypothetical protein Zmor_001608 [Zophobas morio]